MAERLEALYQRLETSPSTGLDSEVAHHRWVHDGPNRNASNADIRFSFLRIAREELLEPTQLLLLSISVLYFLWRELTESLVVLCAVVISLGLEIRAEKRAKEAVHALVMQDMPSSVVVIRDGEEKMVKPGDLVVGDVVKMARGQRVPADARVVHGWGLRVDESMLTGESVAVEKYRVDDGSVEEEAAHGTLYQGTHVLSGRGMGVVTMTGKKTRYAGMLDLAKRESRQLQTHTDTLVRKLTFRLTYLSLLASIFIPLIGSYRGQSWEEAVLAGVSIAFATLPEELPMLIKAILAIGAQNLARKGIVVRRLKVADALGGVDVIVADKTGTITENDLQVAAAMTLFPPKMGDAPLPTIVELTDRHAPDSVEDVMQLSTIIVAAALSADPENLNARQTRTSVAGSNDVMDTAVRDLVHHGDPYGSALALKMLERLPALIHEIPFDPRSKLSARIRDASEWEAGCTLTAAKGAPESILQRCTRAWIPVQNPEAQPTALDVLQLTGDDDKQTEAGRLILMTAVLRDKCMEKVAELSQRGYRVAAYALLQGKLDPEKKVDPGLLHEMVFAGVLAYRDPVLPGIAAAVKECRKAGIRVILATGDHPETALAAAKAAGIPIQPPQASTYTPLHIPNTVHHACPGVVLGEELLHTLDAHIAPIIHSSNVFARTTPEDKVRIVRALKSQGHTVMFVGDGVNDAPALAHADVSAAICVAGRSSAVADAAFAHATLAILDHSRFGVLPTAIKEGRRMRDNLAKALGFFIAYKIALIAILTIAVVSHPQGLFPFAPLQLIILEACMDVGSTGTFIAEPAEEDVLTEGWLQNHSKPGITRAWWSSILTLASLFALTVLVDYWIVAGIGDVDDGIRRMAAFAGGLLGHVMLALAIRTRRVPLRLHRTLTRNRAFYAWVGVVVSLVLMMHISNWVEDELDVEDLTWSQWGWVALGAASIVLLAEMVKEWIWWRSGKRVVGKSVENGEARPLLHDDDASMQTR